jgi:hypothetical protein
MTTPIVTSSPSHDDRIGSDTAEAFVRRHPWVVALGRAGWLAKGVVYTLTGVLALTVVADPFDVAEGEANQTGAVAKIAQQPFGELLLWAMAIGLFIYAAWRIVTVALPADTDGHSVLKRIGYVVSAVVYVVLGVTAISLARRPGSPASGSAPSEDARIETFTADVMGWTGGRWLVGAAGLVVFGIGVYFLVKAVTRKFEKELEHRAVGPLSWDAIRTIGLVGWIGRAAMMMLIGVFLVRAAWRFDPNEARGLDDSLRRIADDSLGVMLVFVVAIGLIAYGVFCIVTAPSQKLIATDDRTVAS